MRIRRVLVGTDLTERCDQAIVRGHQIAQQSGAELVVGHVLFTQIGNHPLFPQMYEAEAVSAATAAERVADTLAARVSELTGRNPDGFVTLIDQGDAASVLTEQAERTESDLIVVMADQERDDEARTVTRDLARSVRCSVLVVGDNESAGAAIVLLQEDIHVVPNLVDAVHAIAAQRPSQIDVVMLMSNQQSGATPLTGRIEVYAAELGVRLEPWFAPVTDTALLTRAATNPAVGLLALAAPAPDALVAGRASPLDDIVRLSHASILLLRPPAAPL